MKTMKAVLMLKDGLKFSLFLLWYVKSAGIIPKKNEIPMVTSM